MRFAVLEACLKSAWKAGIFPWILLRRATWPLLIFFAAILSLSCPADADDYQPLPALIDLRTTFSDGDYDPKALAQLAKSKGFQVVIFTDHDRMAMSYGLPPFRNLLRVKIQKNAINKRGAAEYLQALKEVEKEFPGIIFLPGSESTPFYYWTSRLLKGELTAHDHEKRLLAIGMEKPEDYENLPILDNGYSKELFLKSLPGIMLFFIALVISIFMLRKKGVYRFTGIFIAVVSIAFILDTLMAEKKSPFDAHHGNQGIAPYQLYIDYVNARGGLVFWNYPETQSGVRKLGPINVSTRSYPEALYESFGYTGFSALYGDTSTITEPGNIWDDTLKGYCKGLRKNPPWGIATSDFHREGESGEYLGNFITVLLVREKTKKEVLNALRTGKMYCSSIAYPRAVRLNEFSVSSKDGGGKAISGDEMTMKGNPVIRVSITTNNEVKNVVKVRLIRSGELIKTFEGPLPLQIEYEDAYEKPGEKIYYRMDMKGYGVIVSNPIFVSFEKPIEQSAASAK
jgi:hypothetical protein